MKSGARYTGQGLDRVDARLKVTGQARFAAEIPMSSGELAPAVPLAHAVIVGSPVGAGRITAMETLSAERAPGVLAVITHANAPRLPGAHKGGGDNGRVLQLLQDPEILYNDQPIALVVADTLENARRAATLVKARVTQRTPAIDMTRELANAYTPEKTARGPANSSRGDFDQAFNGAPVRIDATYVTPIENHNPMEMHATIAV